MPCIEARPSPRLPCLVVCLGLLCSPVTAYAGHEDGSANANPGDTLELTPADLEFIQLQMINKHPLLSSSSGIKFSTGQHSVRGAELAEIIFHPHTETHGIKQAIQVNCWRQHGALWDCKEAQLRQYVTHPSQSFEIRVKGTLDYPTVGAVVVATRHAVQRGIVHAENTKGAVTLLSPMSENRLMVLWGHKDGRSETAFIAHPNSTDTTKPENWRLEIFRPDGPADTSINQD